MPDPLHTRPPAPEPLALDLTEAARRIGISARTLTRLVARGELHSFKIARRRLVALDDLRDFIAKQRAAAHRAA